MEFRAATGLATAAASPNLSQQKSIISHTPLISSLSKSRTHSNRKRSMCFLGSKGDSSRKLRSYFFDSWIYPDVLFEEHKDRILWPRSRPSQNAIEARLFGPAIFEASKLKVLFLGTEKDKHPEQLPRTYTLTHSDISAKLTLAISQTINKAQFQGWYSRLQRDEVLAEWKKAQGSMSLHVHCHISGGHWLLDTIAKLRFYIFRKELPLVLEAFRLGDRTLLRKHPELDEALVWVYFESNVKEFNRVECWGPLAVAAKGAAATEWPKLPNSMSEIQNTLSRWEWKRPPVKCSNPCNCCFPPGDIIPWRDSFSNSE